MSRKQQKPRKRHVFRWFLMFLVMAGLVGGWYLLTQTDFATAEKVVPPLPTTADCTGVEAEIAKYDWDRELALAVAKAESSCETEARGDTDLTFEDCAPEFADDAALCAENQRTYGYSVGVFQVRILPGRESCDTYDVATNVKCAYEIYVADGNSFEPWSGYTTGKYQKYFWRTLEEAWPET